MRPVRRKKQGWRLLRVGAIRQRIREVQAEIAEHHGRIDEVLMGKMEIVYQRALEDHQFYAAARAAELQAKFARQVANRRVERTVEAVALPGLALLGLALGGEAAGLGNGGYVPARPKSQNSSQRWAAEKSPGLRLRPVE
ncbi:MAG: hypothetical protein HOH22_04570 [Rhodospirillaceae bacterium]|nr:hypothetical protein [Rhodospirillaceae bacterium]